MNGSTNPPTCAGPRIIRAGWRRKKGNPTPLLTDDVHCKDRRRRPCHYKSFGDNGLARQTMASIPASPLPIVGQVGGATSAGHSATPAPRLGAQHGGASRPAGATVCGSLACSHARTRSGPPWRVAKQRRDELPEEVGRILPGISGRCAASFAGMSGGGWGQPQAAPSTLSWGLAALDPSHPTLPESLATHSSRSSLSGHAPGGILNGLPAWEYTGTVRRPIRYATARPENPCGENPTRTCSGNPR